MEWISIDKIAPLFLVLKSSSKSPSRFPSILSIYFPPPHPLSFKNPPPFFITFYKIIDLTLHSQLLSQNPREPYCCSYTCDLPVRRPRATSPAAPRRRAARTTHGPTRRRPHFGRPAEEREREREAD